jgi:hypothetical protein
MHTPTGVLPPFSPLAASVDQLDNPPRRWSRTPEGAELDGKEADELAYRVGIIDNAASSPKARRLSRRCLQ